VGRAVPISFSQSLRARAREANPWLGAFFPTGLHARARASRKRQRFRYDFPGRTRAPRKRIVYPGPAAEAYPNPARLRRNAIIAATVVLNIAHMRSTRVPSALHYKNIANGFRLLEAK
jgi:hypothetical protein